MAEKKKIRGEIPAKIVWIIGAVFFGIYALTSFFSLRSPDESIIDCLTDAIEHSIYFLAYLFGILYLFRRNRRNAAFVCAVIYAAAYAFGFFRQLIMGGSLSVESITTLILSLMVYAVFAVFTGILVKGQPSAAFSGCLKFWYLPAVLLFLVGLLECFWTELARPDGFLWDGFFLDLTVSVILVIPIITMTRVIKERVRADETEPASP